MPTILIADDEPALRRGNKICLERSGYDADAGFRYIEAEKGEDAWRLYLDEKPDLMILDDRMKDSIRGVEVARRIREGYNGSEPDPDTNILMVSGSLEDEEIPDNTNLLKKPYGFNDLVERVRPYLDSICAEPKVPFSEAETVSDIQKPSI